MLCLAFHSSPGVTYRIECRAPGGEWREVGVVTATEDETVVKQAIGADHVRLYRVKIDEADQVQPE